MTVADYKQLRVYKLAGCQLREVPPEYIVERDERGALERESVQTPPTLNAPNAPNAPHTPRF
jgi:hypothetical protein